MQLFLSFPPPLRSPRPPHLLVLQALRKDHLFLLRFLLFPFIFSSPLVFLRRWIGLVSVVWFLDRRCAFSRQRRRCVPFLLFSLLFTPSSFFVLPDLVTGFHSLLPHFTEPVLSAHAILTETFPSPGQFFK